MRAISLVEPGKIEMADVPKPIPREDEAIIKVGAVGICGSDLRYYHGENPWALHTLGRETKQKRSFTLGHEVSGSIEEVGKLIDKGRIDERVGIIAFKGCGRCHFCRRNLPNLCENTLHIGHDRIWVDVDSVPGGCADWMRIWADKACPIPKEISYEEATQLDGLAVSVHANEIGNVSTGDAVAIFGSSAIGLMIQQIARVRGAKKVMSLDRWDLPLKLAEKLGADLTIDVSQEEEIVNRLKSENDGRGPDVVFDTVGSDRTFSQGVKALSRKGTYVALAVKKKKMAFDMTYLGGEKTIVSSANNEYKDYFVALDLLSNGKVKVEPFITHEMNLDDFEEAFKMLENKEEYNVIKIVLIP